MGREEIEAQNSIETASKSDLRRLKRTAAIGAIVMFPFVASLFFIKWVFDIFKDMPSPAIFNLTSSPLTNQFLKIAALVTLSGAAMLAVGRVASTSYGKKIENRLDSFISRIPVVGTVYSITKTAADTVFMKSEEFKHPVKLSYDGLTLTAFQTGNCSDDGKKVVFIPTSPNITSGFVVEVDEDKVQETDESLEKAFTRVLSAGFSN